MRMILILITIKDNKFKLIFQQYNFLNMLQSQLNLVQAAIFHEILKANKNQYFGYKFKTCKSVYLQAACKFTKSRKLWIPKASCYT